MAQSYFQRFLHSLMPETDGVDEILDARSKQRNLPEEHKDETEKTRIPTGKSLQLNANQPLNIEKDHRANDQLYLDMISYQHLAKKSYQSHRVDGLDSSRHLQTGKVAAGTEAAMQQLIAGTKSVKKSRMRASQKSDDGDDMRLSSEVDHYFPPKSTA